MKYPAIAPPPLVVGYGTAHKPILLLEGVDFPTGQAAMWECDAEATGTFLHLSEDQSVITSLSNPKNSYEEP